MLARVLTQKREEATAPSASLLATPLCNKIGLLTIRDTDSVHVRKRVQPPRFSPSSRAPHYNAEIVRPPGAREKWDSQSQLLYTEVRDACCSQLWPTQQLSGPDSCHYFS